MKPGGERFPVQGAERPEDVRDRKPPRAGGGRRRYVRVGRVDVYDVGRAARVGKTGLEPTDTLGRVGETGKGAVPAVGMAKIDLRLLQHGVAVHGADILGSGHHRMAILKVCRQQCHLVTRQCQFPNLPGDDGRRAAGPRINPVDDVKNLHRRALSIARDPPVVMREPMHQGRSLPFARWAVALQNTCLAWFPAFMRRRIGSIVAYPLSESLLRRSGLRSVLSIVSAKATGDRTSTRRQFILSSITLEMLPTKVVTMGVPWSIASYKTRGNPSSWLGKQNKSASR